MICNVHWQTDVIEGRFMGAATVARLHADLSISFLVTFELHANPQAPWKTILIPKPKSSS